MAEKKIYTVSDVTGEMKIRDYLKSRIGFSTSLIAKVKYGGVILNGTAVHMRATVKNGDIIEVWLPSESSDGIEPIPIPLTVIYEDADILAVNKPKNMPVHPAKGNSLPTLASAVAAYLGVPTVFRAVNRLDRDTSGIVLIAKNQLASAKLARSMKSGEFCKKYTARVTGIPSPEEGIIDAPIEREAEGSIRRTVRQGGKPSQTKYRVISVDEDGNSLCEIELLTGRTHQIRVHFAHIGHPLLCDFLYGEKENGKTYELHCHELTFPHPTSGEMITLRCEPYSKALPRQ